MSNNENKSSVKVGGPLGGGPGGRHGVSFEKPANFKKAWGQLLKYLKPYLGFIIIALLFAVVSAIFTIAGPEYVKQITAIIGEGLAKALQGNMQGIDIKAVSTIAIAMMCVYAVSGILSYVQNYMMATTTNRITQKMRNEISMKINAVPLSYFDTKSFGDTLSRVTNDVDTIGHTLNQSIGSLIGSVTLFFGSLIMMFVTNWILALVAIASAIVGFSFMTIVIKNSQKYFKGQQATLGQINGHIEEIYSGHNVVIANNGQQGAREVFDGLNKKLFSNAWKAQFLSGLMMPLMNFIGNLGYVAVCVVGGAMALSGEIEFPVIVAFLMYIRLFTQPLAQFAQAANNLQSTGAASERVFEFLNEGEMSDESDKTNRLIDIKGDVSFNNVKFSYNSDKVIINNFTAKAKAGQKVAIVGPTGGGKTTLVNLLMRFYELDSGSITIDGVDISTLTRGNIHDMFGMVLQDTWLFKGTVKENIAYSKANATEYDVVSACKAVGVDHFIKTMPHGYNAILDESANISQGQKQLITIARAMVENAPMLILDEATSSVDTRTELLIQQAMDKLMEGRTSFVIAHRLSTIKNADLILVLKDGDIIEQGNHEKLLAQGGFYCELYNSQFEVK